MNYYSVPLARNAPWRACFREGDFPVLFAQNGDPEDLILRHSDILLKRQGVHKNNTKKKTFTVYLVVTEHCNLNCAYCDVLGLYDWGKNGSVMTQENARQALDILTQRLQADPDLFAQMVFFGGEPLLNWPVMTSVLEQIEQHPQRSRIETMVVTNGTLITTERAQLLARHRVYCVVSLDGTAEVNDAVRKKPCGQGSYRDVEQGLDILMQVMPGSFGISCTVGSHNADGLSDHLCSLHERFKPVSIGLNMFHYQQDGKNCIEMPREDLARAMLDAFRTSRERGIPVYQYTGILKGFINRRRNLDYCPACVDKLLFTPSGRVGRCETLMNDKRFTIPLEKMQGTELPAHLDWTAYTPEKEPVCRSCFARWICPGSCAYDQLVTTGRLDGVDPRRCDFHKAFLTEMLDILFDETCAASDTAVQNGDVIVPDETHFKKVAGTVPLEFPPHTIWIVSLSSVTAEAPCNG